jgi:hypothetical protein
MGGSTRVDWESSEFQIEDRDVVTAEKRRAQAPTS